MTRNAAETLEDILTRFVDEVAAPTRQATLAFADRFPVFKHEILRFSVVWAEQEVLPEAEGLSPAMVADLSSKLSVQVREQLARAGAPVIPHRVVRPRRCEARIAGRDRRIRGLAEQDTVPVDPQRGAFHLEAQHVTVRPRRPGERRDLRIAVRNDLGDVNVAGRASPDYRPIEGDAARPDRVEAKPETATCLRPEICADRDQRCLRELVVRER